MYAYVTNEGISQILMVKRNKDTIYFQTKDSWFYVKLNDQTTLMTLTELLLTIPPIKCEEPIGKFFVIDLFTIFGDTQEQLEKIADIFNNHFKTYEEFKQSIYTYLGDLQKLLMTWHNEVGIEIFQVYWEDRLELIFRAQKEIMKEIEQSNTQTINSGPVIEELDKTIIIT